jgi:hypothetical protein
LAFTSTMKNAKIGRNQISDVCKKSQAQTVWFRWSPPGLSAALAGRPRASHIPLDCALRDADAELQQFAANPFRSPEPVLGRHAVDEGDGVWRDTRLA